MRRNWIAYAAVFLLSLALAADGALAQGATGLLTGRVVDAATGAPLAGAVVFMRPTGKRARTGGDGRYAIAGVPAGTYAVQCAKTGYAADTARGIAMAAGARVTHDCRLRPLREEGVLIIGSGFLTHGLPFLREWRIDAEAPGWSRDFDAWAAEALARGDVDALASYRSTAPGMPYAHPTVEHFTPLFVTLTLNELDVVSPSWSAIVMLKFRLSLMFVD